MQKLLDIPRRAKENGAGNGLVKLLGWGVTAGALSFGAPFWFDLLGKVGPLRNAKSPTRRDRGAEP